MDVSEATGTYSFAGFALLAGQRVLKAHGRVVPLSSRAFDILSLLIEHRDRVVSREEILAGVWRGVVVDENNLAVQISTLRRALSEHADGAQFILTIPGQGYKFAEPAHPAPPAPEAARPLPFAVPPMQAPLPAPAVSAWPTIAARRAVVLAGSAIACLVLVAAVFMTRPRPSVSGPPRLSIAVLPFRNLGADVEQNYLADAISDDLTTDLSLIPGSFVIARESADSYRNRPTPTPEIGRALNVRYLLEGSLVKEAAGLHINAQLIDAATGSHLWASAFDVSHDGLSQARVDIVRHIASVLSFTLVQVEAARSLHDRPDNPDAVDLYLRARSILDRTSDLPSLQQAEGLLERAVAAALDYSDAEATLGSVLLHKMRDFDDPDESQDMAHAVKLIGRALASGPQNPVALDAAGLLADTQRHPDLARQDYEQVLAVSPSDLVARYGLAHCARALGNLPGMLEQLREILLVDPLGPKRGQRENMMGMAYLMMMKPLDALEWLQRATAGLPELSTTDASLGWREWQQIYLIAALEGAGRHELAAKSYAAYASLHPYRTIWHLASYDSHALASTAGYKSYLQALQAAGMPPYTSETLGAQREADNVERGDFDLTPLAIEGAQVITTAEVKERVGRKPEPLILDTGRGVAVIATAICFWQQNRWMDQDKELLTAASQVAAEPNRAIIVMSNGPFAWDGYDAARLLIQNHIPHVFWYRGGEESWAAAGLASRDLRDP